MNQAMKKYESFKYILLSERNPSEKSAYYTSPTIWHFENGKITETTKNQVVTRGKGEGRDG